MKILTNFPGGAGIGYIFVFWVENASAPTYTLPARFKSKGSAGPSDATPEFVSDCPGI